MSQKETKASGFDKLVQGSHYWQDLTSREIEAWVALDPVVVIPVGSTEQHGWHLPVKTDFTLVTEVAERAVKKALESTPVLLAPAVPVGCSQHHMEFAGSLTLKDETFIHAMTEIAMCIIHHGFRRVFFVNGHGGNEAALSLVVSGIRHQTDGKVLCGAASYWSFASKEDIQSIRRSGPGGMAHAGEFETSIMMALDSKHVRRDKIMKCVPDLPGEYVATDLFIGGPITIGEHHSDISESGAVGDPTVATVETGRKFLSLVSEGLATAISEFSQWDYPNSNSGKARVAP